MKRRDFLKRAGAGVALAAMGDEMDYVGFFEVPLPEIISFTADDYTIVTGGATNINWEVHEAESVELAGYTPQFCDAWGECRGSAEVTPTTPQEFTLTATGPGRRSSAMRT